MLKVIQTRDPGRTVALFSQEILGLNDLLDSIASYENSFKQATNLILHKENFKNALVGVFASEKASLRKELNDFKFRLVEMEQYFRRNCSKLTGLPEEKNRKH